MRQSLSRCCILFAFVLLFAAGCGPGRGDLSGKVSFNGKPIVTGSVVVVGSDGMVKSAAINPDSTYQIKDIAAGSIKVTVSSPNPVPKEMHSRKKDDMPAPLPKENPNWFPIPDHYADFDKSGLTFSLKRGRNTWDIDLK